MKPNATPGPYKFGDQAPTHLMGFLPETTSADELDRPSINHPSTRSTIARTTPPIPPWTIIKRHNNQKHIPTVEQKTGDCVAAGIAHVLSYVTALQILTEYREQIYHPPHISFIYGISRVQIGGGRIPGPGSTGAWGAAAVAEYGSLFTDDVGAPPYSGNLSDSWGRRPGPPQDMQDLADDNLVLNIERIRTVEQIREALTRRALVTIASNQGFRMQPYEDLGYHVFKPSGTWPHQMSFLAWMDEPFKAAYRLNSWGPDAHGTPLHGEPPGGAWNLATDIEAEIRRYSLEIYAFSIFDADPDEANHELIWIPRNLENVEKRPPRSR